MRKKPGLTGKMLIYTASLGLAVWLVSDGYQTTTLESIFQEKLAKRFSRQAQEHRTLFDRHVKIHSQAAKLLVLSNTLYHYVLDQKWRRSDSGIKIKYTEDTPEWMPSHSALRKFVLPRYTYILDTQNRTRELYHWNGQIPPKEVLNPNPLLLQLSENQSYLTSLGVSPI